MYRVPHAQSPWGHRQSGPLPHTASRVAGRWEWSADTSWTSGFFPGLLWQLANFTGDEEYATLAKGFTAGREDTHTVTLAVD